MKPFDVLVEKVSTLNALWEQQKIGLPTWGLTVSEQLAVIESFIKRHGMHRTVPKPNPFYVVGEDAYCFRRSEPSLVVGAKMLTFDNEKERPCLEVVFSDGTSVFIALSEVGTGNDSWWRLVCPDEVEWTIKAK